jgi:hypothetical protein
MSIKPGTPIGPYEVTSPLGEGGMGVVFRACHLKLKFKLAIPAVVIRKPRQYISDDNTG